MCLEPFPLRGARTVANGAPQRVQARPFQCVHAVCVGCEEQLRARGDGRCPTCRAERKRPLDNDRRAVEGPEFPSISGALFSSDGRVLYPIRATRVLTISRRTAPLPRPAEPGQTAPVALSSDARELVSALRSIGSGASSLASFRALASRMLGEESATRAPTQAAAGGPVPPARFSVRRVRPHNP